MKSNKQYSITNITNVKASLTEYGGRYVMMKNGQTIKQTPDGRIVQMDIASITSKLINICTIVVDQNEDLKLDDKIRDYLYLNDDNFLDYKRKDNKRNEWSLTKFDDLMDDFYEYTGLF